MSQEIRRHIPNWITVSRAVLSLVLFAMLELWDGTRPSAWIDIAIAVYVIAAASDWVDGLLARRWNVVSPFGRVVDPLVDKMLIIGCFVYLAGPKFVDAGVPAMVVVLIILRELLVTALRASAEGGGKKFAAGWSGKAKMVLQSVAIGLLLLLVNYRGTLGEFGPIATLARDVLVWTTAVVTVLSAIPYIVASLPADRYQRNPA